MSQDDLVNSNVLNEKDTAFKRHFDIQLEKLRSKLIRMCTLVDEQLQFALRTIDEQNTEWVKLIVERDAIVDKYDVKIEKYCQRMVALNQPVAMDLRQIMSALNINSNLERIGDIAVSIVENYSLLEDSRNIYQQTKLSEMIGIAKVMLKHSIDSYITGEPKLAEKVILSDKNLDRLNKENHKILINIMKQSPDNIEAGVVFLVISRLIERCGDHATNIAEGVIFIHEATVIRHNYESLFFNDEQEKEMEEE